MTQDICLRFSSDQLDARVQSCVDCYTSDWVVVTRRYQHLSSSLRRPEDVEERLSHEIEATMRHEFEVDEDNSDSDQVRSD